LVICPSAISIIEIFCAFSFSYAIVQKEVTLDKKGHSHSTTNTKNSEPEHSSLASQSTENTCEPTEEFVTGGFNLGTKKLAPATVLGLQRIIGNQAVQRLLAKRRNEIDRHAAIQRVSTSDALTDPDIQPRNRNTIPNSLKALLDPEDWGRANLPPVPLPPVIANNNATNLQPVVTSNSTSTSASASASAEVSDGGALIPYRADDYQETALANYTQTNTEVLKSNFAKFPKPVQKFLFGLDNSTRETLLGIQPAMFQELVITLQTLSAKEQTQLRFITASQIKQLFNNKAAIGSSQSGRVLPALEYNSGEVTSIGPLPVQTVSPELPLSPGLPQMPVVDIPSQIKPPPKPVLVLTPTGEADVVVSDELVAAFLLDNERSSTYLQEGEGELVAKEWDIQATIFAPPQNEAAFNNIIERAQNEQEAKKLIATYGHKLIQPTTIYGEGGSKVGQLLHQGGNHYITLVQLADDAEDFRFITITPDGKKKYAEGVPTRGDGNCLLDGLHLIGFNEKITSAKIKKARQLISRNANPDLVRVQIKTILDDMLKGIEPQGLGPKTLEMLKNDATFWKLYKFELAEKQKAEAKERKLAAAQYEKDSSDQKNMGSSSSNDINFDDMTSSAFLAYLDSKRLKKPGNDATEYDTLIPQTRSSKGRTEQAKNLKTATNYEGMPIYKVSINDLPSANQEVIHNVRQLQALLNSASAKEIQENKELIKVRLGAEFGTSGRGVTPKEQGKMRSWHDNEEGLLPRPKPGDDELKNLPPSQQFYHEWFTEEFTTGQGFQLKQEDKPWRSDIKNLKDYLDTAGVPFVEINAGGWKEFGVGRLIFDYIENRFFITANHYKPFSKSTYKDFSTAEAASKDKEGHNTFYLIVEDEVEVKKDVKEPAVKEKKSLKEALQDSSRRHDDLLREAMLMLVNQWLPEQPEQKEEPKGSQGKNKNVKDAKKLAPEAAKEAATKDPNFNKVLAKLNELKQTYQKATQRVTLKTPDKSKHATITTHPAPGSNKKAKPSVEEVEGALSIEVTSPEKNKFSCGGIDFYVDATEKGNNYIFPFSKVNFQKVEIQPSIGKKIEYQKAITPATGNYSGLTIGELREIFQAILNDESVGMDETLSLFLAAFLAESYREPIAWVANLMLLAGVLGNSSKQATGEGGALKMATGGTWNRAEKKVPLKTQWQEVDQLKEILAKQGKKSVSEVLNWIDEQLGEKKKSREEVLQALVNMLKMIIVVGGKNNWENLTKK
jgi:hypothetical protein